MYPPRGELASNAPRDRARAPRRIGADSRDDEGTRANKSLLVLVSILILPVSLLWGGLYVGLGAPSGLFAFVYFAVSVGAIAVFARTRDFALFLRVELLDILLAPNLSMIFLGGFITSTGVGIWGILAPMGALVFEGVRSGSAGTSRSWRSSSGAASRARSWAPPRRCRRGSRP